LLLECRGNNMTGQTVLPDSETPHEASLQWDRNQLSVQRGFDSRFKEPPPVYP